MRHLLIVSILYHISIQKFHTPEGVSSKLTLRVTFLVWCHFWICSRKQKWEKFLKSMLPCICNLYMTSTQMNHNSISSFWIWEQIMGVFALVYCEQHWEALFERIRRQWKALRYTKLWEEGNFVMGIFCVSALNRCSEPRKAELFFIF